MSWTPDGPDPDEPEPWAGADWNDDPLRRMGRGLRPPRHRRLRPLSPAEVEHRERVRMRALSLLGTLRPELHDLDALGWGEALERVCDAIIDLWICEECHEQGSRCLCVDDEDEDE